MRHIAVFCGSHKGKNPHFQSAAQRLGQLIAMQGRTLIYGGSNFGYMGVVSEAAMQAGGYVVGVIPTLFSDEVIQSQRVSELVKVASMAERKEVIIQRADAFVAFPGGIGTLDEVTEVMVANQLGMCCKPVGLLNVDGYYDAFIAQMALMSEEGLMREGLGRTLFVASTPDEMLQMLDGFNPDYDREIVRNFRR